MSQLLSLDPKHIEVIAPASFSPREEYEFAKVKLESWGFKVSTAHAFNAGEHPFFSNTDAHRLTEIKKAIYESDAKYIWCMRGGYGTPKLLSSMSHWELPKKKLKGQKCLIGFSDITALHQFFNVQWGFKTIHGPGLSSFSNPHLDPKSLDDIKKLLLGKIPSAMTLEYLNKELGEVDLCAKTTGGTLTLINGSLGTPFQFQFKNKFLLVEDVGERGYKIDRYLNQLLLSGLLKGVKAIVFGDFTLSDEKDGKNYVNFAIQEFIHELKNIIDVSFQEF